MHAQDGLARDGAGAITRKCLESLGLQRLLDGAQTLRALGMSLAHFVQKRDGVR